MDQLTTVLTTPSIHSFFQHNPYQRVPDSQKTKNSQQLTTF